MTMQSPRAARASSMSTNRMRRARASTMPRGKGSETRANRAFANAACRPSANTSSLFRDAPCALRRVATLLDRPSRLLYKTRGRRLDIIEIPNAIPKAYQDQVEFELGSDRMLWTYHEESARSASPFKNAFSGFSHVAFLASDEAPVISPMSSLLMPILFVFCDKAKIEYNALLRIRVGLFTRTPIEAEHHNPHVDFVQPHRTAVYYVNDCDGDTFIFDQTVDDVSVDQSARFANENKFTIAGRVPPKKGKMTCFDGRYYHASSYPTRASRRIAITFNFV
jgi:hypothetical protein